MVVLAVVAVAALLAVGITRVGVAAAHRASAQAAADAVALAAAADGPEAARAVARANQARVVVLAPQGHEISVTIERRGATATARARWQPLAIP